MTINKDLKVPKKFKSYAEYLKYMGMATGVLPVEPEADALAAQGPSAGPASAVPHPTALPMQFHYLDDDQQLPLDIINVHITKRTELVHARPAQLPCVVTPQISCKCSCACFNAVSSIYFPECFPCKTQHAHIVTVSPTAIMHFVPCICPSSVRMLMDTVMPGKL
jgi:hypothetical protein